MAGLQYFVAGHPVPTAASFEAGHATLDLLRKCDERTLIFFLISGGGSTLVELPLHRQLTLEDVRELNRVLVSCGASIDEINTVRKHLSAVKGGRLAAAAPRAMKLTCAVTDVPEGKESALASGPTIPDPTTLQDMERVLSEFGLRAKLPARVQNFLTRGGARETPKQSDPAFARAQFQILLGMHDLFHAAHRAAESAGFVTICDNTTDDWPLPRATDYLLDQLAELQRSNPGRFVAVIADGEVRSPVSGNGIGGRNSAFVLDCVEKIAEKKISVLSAGTDGVDGVSPAAGAVADGETLARARAAGLDPSDYSLRSDSHTFFQGLDDAIVTGPTGNNLRDLRILLAER
jgi:hydroxypyruvate reductase